MAVYLISKIKMRTVLTIGECEVAIYSKPIIMEEPHSPHVSVVATALFDESFTKTQNARNGWELVGEATIHIMTKAFYDAHYHNFDDDLQPLNGTGGPRFTVIK